jgi:hypothetical protein
VRSQKAPGAGPALSDELQAVGGCVRVVDATRGAAVGQLAVLCACSGRRVHTGGGGWWEKQAPYMVVSPGGPLKSLFTVILYRLGPVVEGNEGGAEWRKGVAAAAA